MDMTRDNIGDYMRNDEYITRVQSTIFSSSMWMDIAHDNIGDDMRNDEYITRVQSITECTSK